MRKLNNLFGNDFINVTSLDEFVDMLDHISTRVVLVKDDHNEKLYSVEYGKDKAMVSIRGSNAIINVSYNGKLNVNRIVLREKPELIKLQKQLELQSKIGPMMSAPGIINVHTKTLKVQQQMLRPFRAKEEY